MGCAEEKIIAKLKSEEDIPAFCDSWRKRLGEGDLLSFYDKDFDLENEFRDQQGEYVFEIQDYPLFKEWQAGEQAKQFALGFAKDNPEIDFVLEYVAVDDSCGEAVFDTYHYTDWIMNVRQAYSEDGLGDYCEECDAEFEDYLIKKDLADEEDEYCCPECGEELDYSAQVDKYELKLVDGEWNTSNGSSVQEKPDDDFDKYMTGMVRPEITNAWKYEDELDEQGFLPEEIHGNAAWDKLPRVRKKAEEGDEKAIQVLADFESINNLV